MPLPEFVSAGPWQLRPREEVLKTLVGYPIQDGTDDVLVDTIAEAIFSEVSANVEVCKKAAYAVEFKDVISAPQSLAAPSSISIRVFRG